MCGIAGYAGDFLPGLARRMNAAQARPGGVFSKTPPPVAFGHVFPSLISVRRRHNPCTASTEKELRENLLK